VFSIRRRVWQFTVLVFLFRFRIGRSEALFFLVSFFPIFVDAFAFLWKGNLAVSLFREQAIFFKEPRVSGGKGGCCR